MRGRPEILCELTVCQPINQRIMFYNDITPKL